MIRISKKLDIEIEILKENEAQFKLVCRSLIFDHQIINQIGQFSQNITVSELIKNRIPITINNQALNNFLQLFYQLQNIKIPYKTDIER